MELSSLGLGQVHWVKCNVDAVAGDKQVAVRIVYIDDRGSAANVWVFKIESEPPL